MTKLEFTKQEIEELCFSLLHDKLSETRSKTRQKNFEKGRRKLLKELKKLETNV